jgi:hypothetical protein
VLASAIGAWLADRDRHQDRDRPGPATRRPAVAVDGKTLRGADHSSLSTADESCIVELHMPRHQR